MKKIEVTDASFHRNEEDISDLELNLSVDKSVEKRKINTYRVTLVTNVYDNNENLRVSVTALSIFETDHENKYLIESNAIAIIFPYVRSYITSLTTQPGMEPIVIPPINVLSLLKDKGTIE
ncbi:MAG: protein-export chaperone SecB [Lachnospiraceae bacterium]|nr:protein-export chaperone SecB [Lachnospiraceae bacterium]